MTDSLHDRGEALENLFFKQRDQELLDAMREKMSAEQGRTELKSSSGIEDDSVIDALLASGVKGETIAAVGLIPLVVVAWADRKMEASESAAVLKAAIEGGISSDSESYAVIKGWLDEQPSDDLFATWKQYIGALKTDLNEGAFTQLKNSVVRRATDVAEAAGGFLGFGNKVSDVEQKVIDELSEAFG